MPHDLLLQEFDRMTNMFINGDFDYDLWVAIEKEYHKRKELFTIYLN